MFIPQRLQLQNGNETLTQTISIESSDGGRFIVRVINTRKYPATHVRMSPSGGGNFDTHLYDTEQQAIERATKLVHESLAQGYLIV
jgi:hypothetical protein